MRVGISFVDAAGARRNLDAEAPDVRLRRHARRARARRGTAQLARVEVDGGTAARPARVLHRALPRAAAPERLQRRRRPLPRLRRRSRTSPSGRTQYANFSSLGHLQGAEPAARADPAASATATCCCSLLADVPRGRASCRAGASRTSTPRTCPATRSIPMIADGVVPRAARRGAERAALYAAARRPRRAPRRPSSARLGYLPMQAGHDARVRRRRLRARAARRRARATTPTPRAGARALAATTATLLDPETRLDPPAQRRRHLARAVLDPTDETGFQEGNSWQYSWLAPHDARGLFDRMGGDAVARRAPRPPLPLPARGAATALTFFGIVYRFDMYAPGNEHDLQVPWMYAFAGQPWRDAATSCATSARSSAPTPDGLPGNDDLGVAVGLARLVGARLRPGHAGRAVLRRRLAAVRAGRRCGCRGGPAFTVVGARAPRLTAPLRARAAAARAARWTGRGSSTRWPRAGRWSCRWSAEPDTAFGAGGGREAAVGERLGACRSSAAGRGSVPRGGPGSSRRPRLRVSVAPRRVRAGQAGALSLPGDGAARDVAAGASRAPGGGALRRAAGADRPARARGDGQADAVVRRYRVVAARRGFARGVVRVRVLRRAR